MLRAVCLDLDGTLLNDKKEISNRSLKLLNDLIEKNIEVIIATGRHFYMVCDFLQALKKDIIVCANNGAMSRFKESSKLIDVSYLKNEDFNYIFEKSLEFGLNPYVYVDSFVEGYHLVVKDGMKKRSHFEEEIVDKRILENAIRYYRDVDVRSLNSVLCVAFLDNRENIYKFYDFYKDKNNLIKNIYKVPDGRFVLEVQSERADKWTAISKYIESKNISHLDVVSFGDELNDCNMISNSGIGFAMKNGIDELKSLTENITEFSNNEDGVYFELKKLFNDVLGE